MKRQILIVWTLALAMRAHATLYSFDVNGVNAAIPDGNPVGMSSSTNYSLGTLPMDGTSSTIVNVDVRLNITGGYNGDLYGYLLLSDEHNEVMTAVLLNRVGRSGAADFGYGNTGFNVTLSGSGANNIHNYQGFSPSYNGGGQLTGTWKADGITNNPAGSFATTSGAQDLSVLNGLSANGTWTLFLADMVGGDTSTLASWGVDISVVPEPITWALMIFGAAVTAVAMRRRQAAR
jgi:subtilisin-like proprotein convertase family protein